MHNRYAQRHGQGKNETQPDLEGVIRAQPKYWQKKSGQSGVILLCLASCAGVAQAQSVITPPPVISTTPAAVQDFQNQGAGTILPPGGAPSANSGDGLFQLGPVVAKPHFYYRLLYGTGIQVTPGQSEKSVINSFSPGILLSLGSHWTLDYTPTLSYYSSKLFHDSLDESATLSWGTAYEDWTFGFSQSYTATSDPLVETGAQTSTESYNTSLNASYRFNSVLSLDLGLSQYITSADQLNSSRSWSTLDWLNYQFEPQLNFAIGAGVGYDSVSIGPNMTHEQLQGRISWRVAEKLSLVVHGGAEDRQFLTGGVSDKISPVYGAAIQYHPFEYTSLSLQAERAVTVSYIDDQVTDGTTLSVSVDQRFLEKLTLDISGGYSTVDYLAATVLVPTMRQDKLYSISTRLSYELFKRASAALTYQYSKNSSTQAGFTFASSQVGFELGYKF